MWTKLSLWAGALRRRKGGARPVAVISNLPPQATGIANFTRRLFHSDDGDFRIYSDAVKVPHDGGPVGNGSGTGAPAAFPIECLLPHHLAEGFSAAVFMLGNSPHSVAGMRALHALARSDRPPPLWAYVHEPYLNGLLAPWVGLDELPTALRRSYPERMPTGGDSPPLDTRELLERRILGARALFEPVRLQGIFVNSQFALELLRADYPEFPAGGIKRLFHPVFAAAAPPAHRPRGRPLRIGSFGVPNPYKNLHVVLDALGGLRAREPGTKLVLSGYGMAAFVAERGLGEAPGLELHESPTEEVFEALMASVDVAVQLRGTTFGESPGTVSQLVALRRPTIVSRIGSFADFGDAVCFAPDDVTPENLADLVLTEVEQPDRRQRAMAAYAAAHEPRRLLRLLRRELLKGRGLGS